MILREQTEQLKQDVLARMPQSIVKNFQDDIAQLKIDKLKEKALQIGSTVPNGLFTDIQGTQIDLKSIHTSDFLILNFYRGGWCPYCNMELREYERLKDEFKAINTNIVGISSEMPKLTIDTHQKNTLSYPVLADSNADFMKQVGVVFELSTLAKKDFEGFGMDFTKINGNTNFELPVPAIYVIDKNFKIIFIHFEEDYMTRLEPTDLLTTLKNKTI